MVRFAAIAVRDEHLESLRADEAQVWDAVFGWEAEWFVRQVMAIELRGQRAGVVKLDEVIGRGRAAVGLPLVDSHAGRGADGLRNVCRAFGRLAQDERARITQAS